LYIEALKTREPTLASRAAMGIAEIGDPQGDAVPYLIDTLEFRAAQPIDLATTYTSSVFASYCSVSNCSPSRAIVLTYNYLLVEHPGFRGVVSVDDRNLAVMDALTKVTDRKLGYNRDEWQRWWANEKKNRDLEKSRSKDHVLKSQQTAS
jgi:hypothetical protein